MSLAIALRCPRCRWIVPAEAAYRPDALLLGGYYYLTSDLPRWCPNGECHADFNDVEMVKALVAQVDTAYEHSDDGPRYDREDDEAWADRDRQDMWVLHRQGRCRADCTFGEPCKYCGAHRELNADTTCEPCLTERTYVRD